MDSRLRKLEERAGERCPECAGGAGIVVTYDETEAEAPEKRCPRCGRALTIIRVVYEDEAEPGGGGSIADV